MKEEKISTEITNSFNAHLIKTCQNGIKCPSNSFGKKYKKTCMQKHFFLIIHKVLYIHYSNKYLKGQFPDANYFYPVINTLYPNSINLLIAEC